ncbi:ragulator complex protein LAMTOR3 homolog [Phlebotomus papatasi]|uniref:Roadblock/LAMTOR2 domain-containing protein n=1 Tax=Phlebotomus papatasi TaxID=29031 RepID=A0A1B0F0N6_PHLPP|nr:ragulator complex protein LAMTOR3 homolog [Phlebotomus papatasi]
MTDDVKKFFTGLLHKVSGLHCIAITDRDGVLVTVTGDRVPEPALKAPFLSTFTNATDQASKLGLGKNKNIICMYSNYQIVQMNKLPLIVTFIGNQNCNVGHILAIENQIDAYLDEIKQAVTES